MKRKGFEVRRANHLGYRLVQDGETDFHGKAIHPGYVVIVSIKKCRLYKKNGRQHYDPTNAPAIPVVYSRSNMAYGKWRKGDGPNYVRGKWAEKYWTCPVYWVEDGRVYQGTTYRIDVPPCRCSEQPVSGRCSKCGGSLVTPNMGVA